MRYQIIKSGFAIIVLSKQMRADCIQHTLMESGIFCTNEKIWCMVGTVEGEGAIGRLGRYVIC